MFKKAKTHFVKSGVLYAAALFGVAATVLVKAAHAKGLYEGVYMTMDAINAKNPELSKQVCDEFRSEF